MKEADMAVAENLAQTLFNSRVDPNEVASTVAFMNQQEDGATLYRYLDTVITDGQAVVRSGRTLDYYRNLLNACKKHLHGYTNQPEEMTQILGWAARLMRFQSIERSLEQPPTREIQRAALMQDLQTKSDRSTGTIKNYDAEKGFGFIQPDADEGDQFFHKSQLPNNLQNPTSGQRVSYVSGKGKNGRTQAQQLRIVKEGK